MQIVKSLSVLPPSPLYNLLFIPKLPFFSSFSSLANTVEAPNPALFHYLMETLKFSKTQALLISTRYSHIKSMEKPQSVFCFFQNLGFSNSHIQSAILLTPQILFANIEKSLKPKIKLFQDIGLVGCDLGKFISKNSPLLTASLKEKLVPRIEILKKLLLNDEKNEDLVKVIRRCNWLISKNPESRLLSNITYLKSCGIVGSQLSMLLKRQPRLFVMQESRLRDLVSRVLNMGFSINSRMLVHALYTVSCLSDETFERKFGILKSYGFSEYECIEMFRKAPGLLRTSKEKLKLGIDFFLNVVKFKKEVLLHNPTYLMHSMEERVIPRYKVLEIMKSKKIFKKEPSFINVLHLTEEEFLQKFISRFPDDALELLIVYKGNILDSSS
ncbi:hypothetical protein P3X46_025117 [Hevea brasiliensis]|uniref:Uncharacterized protein n=1 Tax=Hevea brasiliensis TaxID=3981 RepID=A0ABQ9L6B6_HEVBR|nr:hypothetical protein P3X46_025117 [Hevea brasiliensis]